jgi:hypothetical protein
MIKEWGKIWKEVVIACFKVLSEHLPGGTEENHNLRIDGLQAKNLIWGLHNTKQEC